MSENDVIWMSRVFYRDPFSTMTLGTILNSLRLYKNVRPSSTDVTLLYCSSNFLYALAMASPITAFYVISVLCDSLICLLVNILKQHNFWKWVNLNVSGLLSWPVSNCDNWIHPSLPASAQERQIILDQREPSYTVLPFFLQALVIAAP